MDQETARPFAEELAANGRPVTEAGKEHARQALAGAEQRRESTRAERAALVAELRADAA